MRWQGICGGSLFVAALACFIPAASAADKISIGVVDAASDAALFIAQERGYYKDEGLEASFVELDSGAKMPASLGAGQLDIGGGAASAGLYNAVGRGIKIRIVADKGHNVAGAGYQALMVRKDLIDSGAVKSIRDLKGRKVAISAQGSSDASVLNEAMKSVGLTYGDVEKIISASRSKCRRCRTAPSMRRSRPSPASPNSSSSAPRCASPATTRSIRMPRRR